MDLGSTASLMAANAGPAGTVSLVLPIPNNPAFTGFNIAFQGIVLDAGATLGFTTTNGIDVTFDF